MQEIPHVGDIAVEAASRSGSASRFSEMCRAEDRAARHGMGVLATIGATSPFVGLFGTVWGIMNSFIGISKSQTTNLAVVAPGIAEALLATAFGLAAAIPAVIIYNHFSRVDERLSRTRRPRRPAPSGGCCRATSTASSGRDRSRARRNRPMAAPSTISMTKTRFRGNPRDQRHAVHRCDAGSPDHLHGSGAAVDGGPAGRSAVVDRDSEEAAGQADYVTIKGDLVVAIGETPVKRSIWSHLWKHGGSDTGQKKSTASSCAPTAGCHTES